MSNPFTFNNDAKIVLSEPEDGEYLLLSQDKYMHLLSTPFRMELNRWMGPVSYYYRIDPDILSNVILMTLTYLNENGSTISNFKYNKYEYRDEERSLMPKKKQMRCHLETSFYNGRYRSFIIVLSHDVYKGSVVILGGSVENLNRLRIFIENDIINTAHQYKLNKRGRDTK